MQGCCLQQVRRQPRTALEGRLQGAVATQRAGAGSNPAARYRAGSRYCQGEGVPRCQSIFRRKVRCVGEAGGRRSSSVPRSWSFRGFVELAGWERPSTYSVWVYQSEPVVYDPGGYDVDEEVDGYGPSDGSDLAD